MVSASANTKIFYSDGIKFLVDFAYCWWLIDDIVSAQTFGMVSANNFQIWVLEKTGKKSAVLRCESEHGTILFKKTVCYTEFPLPRVVIYMMNKTVMLASDMGCSCLPSKRKTTYIRSFSINTIRSVA